jgi:hypothetical protein
MDERIESLSKLPAKRVETMLLELAQLRRRAKQGENVVVPLATLYLASGRAATGFVLDLGEDRRGPCVLFQLPGDDPRSPRTDVLYVEPASIEGLVVHDAGSVAHLLSFGAIDTAPGTPPPSRLELRRRAEEHARAVSDLLGAPIALEIAWEGVPDSKEAMFSLGELLADALSAVKKIAEDAFGKGELARQVKRIRLANAEAPGAKREGEVLSIFAALGSGSKGRLDRVSLIVAIGAEI